MVGDETEESEEGCTDLGGGGGGGGGGGRVVSCDEYRYRSVSHDNITTRQRRRGKGRIVARKTGERERVDQRRGDRRR